MNVRKKYFLMEGQQIITNTPVEIITVLGSCVSVCLWDKKLKIGGINHYLLPGNDIEESLKPNHGIASLRLLIKSMLRRECSIENLEAKIFGGCNAMYEGSTRFEIGKKNIEVGLAILKEKNIPLVAKDVGGHYGRKIIFNTRTGKVLMRLLNKPSTLINEEINKGFGV